MALRISPYLLGLIDWQQPLSRSDPHPIPARGSQQLPDHPELRLDSLHERRIRPSGPDAPLSGQGALSAARFLSGLLPLLHAQLRHRRRYREVEKAKAYSARCSAGRRLSPTSRSRPELEDIVISGGDTYNLKAEHIQLIGERLLQHAEHPADSLRHERPLRHAAENSDRRMPGSMRSRAWSNLAASCTRTWWCTRISITRMKSPASRRTRWIG